MRRVIAFLAAILGAIASGQTRLEDRKLLNDPAGPGDSLGYSIAVSGNLAVVGAYLAEVNGVESGAAYVFDMSTGQQIAALVPNDGGAGDAFGASVDICGGTAIVGAWLDDGVGVDSGSAYIFDVTTGAQLVKLTPDDAEAGDEFGISVAISGNVAVVGARLDDQLGENAGAAYVFDVSTGDQLAKLLAIDGLAGDQFGRSVALSGEIAAIGAWFDGDNGEASGSAYVFNVVTRQQLAKLLPNDGAPQDRFGVSVDISGDMAVVGSYFDDDGGSESGSAYVFSALTAQQIAKLAPDDASAGDQFGISVAIAGSRAIVGSHFAPPNGADSGSAYLFDAHTGQQIERFLPSDGSPGDQFGRSVALSWKGAVVGAIGDDEQGEGSGSAYVFENDTDSLLTKVVPCDVTMGATVGFSVAAFDEMALVGAFNDGVNGTTSGSAFLIDSTTGQVMSKLVPDDGSASAAFGFAVAVDRGTAIIGAPFDDDLLQNAGSAYMFDLATGDQIAKLHPSDALQNDTFGAAVDVSGDLAVIGAPEKYEGGFRTGAAYVFDISTGQQIVKLLPDGGLDADFGVAVDVEDDVVLIGAQFDTNDLGVISGAAYLFDALTGQRLAKLVANDGNHGDQFGRAVARSNGLALIGARTDDNGESSGSVYVFDIVSGAQVAKIIPDDSGAGHQFGLSIAVSGGIAVIGSPVDDGGAPDSGSAYVYEVASWRQLAKLTAHDSARADLFARASAIGEGTVLLGAPFNAEQGLRTGAVYIHEFTLCPADLDGDGDADADDFFDYLDAFSSNNLAACDVDGNGDCDADDFFAYLDSFAAGC